MNELLQLPIATILLLVVISTFMLAWYTMPIVINVSKMKSLLAQPEERSSHSVPVPTLGGIGIFISLITGICFWSGYMGIATDQSFEGFPFLFLALLILFFVGIKDDLVVLSPRKKFLAQFIAAALVVIGADIRLQSLYGVLSIYELPYWISISISVVLYVFLVNAYNLIDGIDGLAAGLGSIAASFFGIICTLEGDYTYAVVAFSLTGALLGFLRFNFSKRRKIFMGDTGSMLLGFILAVFAVKFLAMDVSNTKSLLGLSNSPVMLMSVLFIPIFDTLRVFLIRILDGRNPFSPDKNHVHHILLRFNLSHVESSLALYFTNVLLIILGFFLADISVNIFLIALVFTLFVSVFFFRDPKRQFPFLRLLVKVKNLIRRLMKFQSLKKGTPPYFSGQYDPA